MDAQELRLDNFVEEGEGMGCGRAKTRGRTFIFSKEKK